MSFVIPARAGIHFRLSAIRRDAINRVSTMRFTFANLEISMGGKDSCRQSAVKPGSPQSICAKRKTLWGKKPVHSKFCVLVDVVVIPMRVFLQDLAQHAFLQHAAAAAVLASLACGIVGSYVVARRRTAAAGAISHCVLAGLGLSHYVQSVHGVLWLTPLVGATLAAAAAACLVGVITCRGDQRTDTALSAVWAVGMALGISLLAAVPDGAGQEDLQGWLFGSILLVTREDLVLTALLDAAIVGTAILCHEKFVAIGFNRQLAALRGIRVEFYEFLLLGLTALTVVVLVRVVGVVLVIALLALPPAAAGVFTLRLAPMMLGAVLVSLGCTLGGLALSYAPDWPTGATIVELAGGVYLLALVLPRARACF
ncbi:MAG: metal ABC transporter permease [Myxococcota bacterium]